MVIRSVATNDFNTIDPAVFQDVNGELWLCFGSYWSGIKLIQLDSKTGKRVKSDSPIYPLAHANAIEAPYLYHHDGKYYLFVNWGQCCKGTNSTYSIHIGRSDSITGPYMDKEGKYLLAGGGSLFLETKGDFIGPGHAGIFSDKGKDWFSCHYYNGTRGGKPTLAILPLRWETNGWPEIIIEK
jgi:arabinan endo-1,5-alpha-L-arabinosidase